MYAYLHSEFANVLIQLVNKAFVPFNLENDQIYFFKKVQSIFRAGY